MIGYTFAATVYDENGADRRVTVLLGLDPNSETPTTPSVDIRLRDGEGSGYILSVDLEDLYGAVNAVHSQHFTWTREQERAAVA